GWWWPIWGGSRGRRPASSGASTGPAGRSARFRRSLARSWSRPTTSGSSGSAPRARALAEKLQQHLLTEKPDRAQHSILVHARPLQSENHGGDAEPVPITGDLVDDARRVADQEPVERQLVEARV